jgi:Ethanolamine utilization protein EutJ (predicted chaperonin)
MTFQNSKSTKQIEAYVSVPYTWNEKQRETLIEAAESAGIHVLKLIPDPLAALANVRRIERNGIYCICGTMIFISFKMHKIFSSSLFLKIFFSLWRLW